MNNEVDELIKLADEQVQNKNFADAIQYYEQYLRKDALNYIIHNRIGYLYGKINRDEFADLQIKYFEKAVELKHDYTSAIRNLALTYPFVGKYEQAFECFYKLFNLGAVADDYFAYACLKIRLGDFEEGWEYYESRFLKKYGRTEYPKIDKPFWEGEEISDKTLLVQYEQGFGDTIMFFRYLQWAKPLVGKIIFRVQDEMIDLIKDSFVKKIVLTGKELGEFDNDSDLRKAAIDYYKNNLQGTSVNHSQLGEIKFTRKGIEKTRGASADLRKLKSIPVLKDLIKQSKFEGSLDIYKSRKDVFTKFHYLKNNVNIGEEPFEHRIIIGEDIHGNKYYDINDINDINAKNDNSPSAITKLQNLGANELNNIIPNSNEKINPKINSDNIEVVGISTSLEDLSFDYHIPLISLLMVLKAKLDNIPLSQGYLIADEEKVQRYKKDFFDNDCFKIGISWHGAAAGNARRDILLKYFYPLTKLENVKVYSFQKGFGEREYKKLPPDVEIIDLGKTFNDFSDTAAAMANLDLFITSDNAVFNLAGAMGKKTFVLLNKHCEWRWFLDEESTPWYKSVKIFRKQNENDTWEFLMQEVIKYYYSIYSDN